MPHFFIDNLRKYGTISTETEKLLLPLIQHCTKPKGAHLLLKGQLTTGLYILEKGIMRFYYEREGKEVTTWFCKENQVAFSSAFFFKIRSFENIQLLEDSSIYYVKDTDFNQLYKESEEMNTIGRKLSEEYCMEFEERVASLQTQTALQRYEKLLSSSPDIFQRVPLGQIASYLAISQETLSRIRRKFAKNATSK
ncbi:Crp/Fnr family transcriptional regulator [Bacteroides propionicifaciens]|jgi:CRP/FNR family transcriptional regulator, anaerobic regulatory protein|uniref:Crp/Fnr family transcriptional regulator n=1 Tax=Bacteroides propionicifaciens TaxID=392838 RepID=UPI00037A2E5B|nr:Crp/Fnr family transcriptional regulator [Bacteroides propionicifaciens]